MIIERAQREGLGAIYTAGTIYRASYKLQELQSQDGNEEEWMSVKPDRWIRRMALEHKMIEPFTDRQVRGRDQLWRVVVWVRHSRGR